MMQDGSPAASPVVEWKASLRTVAIAFLSAFLIFGFLSGCAEEPHKPKLEEVHTFYSPD